MLFSVARHERPARCVMLTAKGNRLKAKKISA
jgi:hypothetical protein